MAALRAEIENAIRQYDQNQDGTLTFEEADEAQQRIFGRERKEFDRNYLRADLNGDLALSPEEIFSHFDPKVQETVARLERSAQRRTGFDPKIYDLDKNSVVERQEIYQYMALVTQAKETEVPSFGNTGRCDLPVVPENAVVTLVTGTRGAGLSAVSVAGQSASTSVVRLIVPEGVRPIYLVLKMDEPTIFQIEGDLSRISHVIAGHRSGAVGVEGPSTEQVEFRTVPDCFGTALLERNGAFSQFAIDNLVRSLGHEFDHLIQTPFVEANVETGRTIEDPSKSSVLISKVDLSIVLASRQPAELPADASPLQILKSIVAEEFIADWPEGLVFPNPDKVVSPVVPQAYDLLPGFAWLNTLLQVGYLSVGETPFDLQLNAPLFRWPGDLKDTLPLSILLPDSVPMPKGDVGMWSVFEKESNECLAGPRCR